MKFHNIFFIIIAMICLAWQCSKDKEIPSEIEIYGTVVDKKTNLPLKGVIIEVSRQGSFNVLFVERTYTDTFGKYDIIFKPISASYFISFGKEFFADASKNIDVYNAKQEFNIQMMRDSTNWVYK